MTQTAPAGLRARVMHAIPGRLRLRLEGGGQAEAERAVALLRLAPGVLGVEYKAASRSAVVRYDRSRTTDLAVVAELAQAGIEVRPTTAFDGAPASPPPPDPLARTGEEGSTQGPRGPRDARGRFVRTSAESAAPPGGGTSTRSGDGAADSSDQPEQASEGRSTLMELLIGPPPKLDRRFAESLALSAVSLVGARQVAMAFGGGMTLPAYFAIWFALRRLTGMGRRR
jgi:hypothetical protein